MRGKLYKVIESRGEKTYIRIGFTFMWKSIRHHTKSHEFHCQHYWSGVRGFGFWKHQEHLHIFGSSRAQPKQILAFPWFFIEWATCWMILELFHFGSDTQAVTSGLKPSMYKKVEIFMFCHLPNNSCHNGLLWSHWNCCDRYVSELM